MKAAKLSFYILHEHSITGAYLPDFPLKQYDHLIQITFLNFGRQG